MDDICVTYWEGDAHFSLNYPSAFALCDLNNLRKLLEKMVKGAKVWVYAERGIESLRAVQDTVEALKRYTAETEKAWADASRAFQKEFRDPRNYCGELKKSIKKENEHLVMVMKACKHSHERAVKIQHYFDELRDRYGM